MAWPWNQPGWIATAPPVVGQIVRFVVVGMPPPGQRKVSDVFGEVGEPKRVEVGILVFQIRDLRSEFDVGSWSE